MAEVPSLINYQGRLVTADGAAQSGQKSFLLEVFDAASGGSLLYREDVGSITLGDGGVYSFQFGATGTSNTQVTETIGTGGEGAEVIGLNPGAAVPFGFVQVGPDTRDSAIGQPGFYHFGGYFHEDDLIDGFAHTHANGMGVNDLGGMQGEITDVGPRIDEVIAGFE